MKKEETLRQIEILRQNGGQEYLDKVLPGQDLKTVDDPQMLELMLKEMIEYLKSRGQPDVEQKLI